MACVWTDDNGNQFIGSRQEFFEYRQKQKAAQIKREKQAARQQRQLSGRDLVYAPAENKDDGRQLRDELRKKVHWLLYENYRRRASDLGQLIKSIPWEHDAKKKAQLLIDIAHLQCDIIKIVCEQLNLPAVVAQLKSYYDANIAPCFFINDTKEWRNFHMVSLETIPARLRAALPEYLKWGKIPARI